MSSRRRAQPQPVPTPGFSQSGFNPAAPQPTQGAFPGGGQQQANFASPAAAATAAAAPAMTLPQIIDFYGKRLNTLENQIKAGGGQTAPAGPTPAQVHEMVEQRLKVFAAQIPAMIPPIPAAAATPVLNDEILQEFNGRFEMLAHEIDDLKNLLLNLQKYTMDVNRKLLEKAGVLDAAAVDGAATFMVPEEEEDDEEDEGIRIQYAGSAPPTKN